MSALDTARQTLAEQRDLLDDLKRKRNELARSALTDQADLAKLRKLQRECAEQAVVLSDLDQAMVQLQNEAEAEALAETKRQEYEAEQQRRAQAAADHKRRWSHPMSAERVFRDTIRSTVEWKVKVDFAGDKADHVGLTAELVEFFVPSELVERSYDDDCTAHRVKDLTGFIRWIHANAGELVKPNHIASEIERAKANKRVAQSMPQVERIDLNQPGVHRLRTGGQPAQSKPATQSQTDAWGRHNAR